MAPFPSPWSKLFWLLVCFAGWLTSASLAAAEAPSVAVAVEVDGADGLSALIRDELAHQAQTPIVTLRDLAAKQQAPQVMITASVAGREIVSVMYWDETGTVDLLTAPVVRGEAGLVATVSTLAAALIQRNLSRLARPCLDEELNLANCRTRAVRAGDSVAMRRVLLASPRTFPVTVEDF